MDLDDEELKATREMNGADRKLKNNRIGLVKLEVFINLDDLEKGEDCIEIDFNYVRHFVKEDIRELIDKFGQDVQDYFTV